MADYILLMSQRGGCDYTIGCGYMWEEIESDSHEGAIKLACEVANEYGGTEVLTDIELIKIEDSRIDILDILDNKRAKAEEREAKLKKSKKVKKEKADLKRLKEKYEK